MFLFVMLLSSCLSCYGTAATHLVNFKNMFLFVMLLSCYGTAATPEIMLPGGGQTELLPGPTDQTYEQWLDKMLQWRQTTSTSLNITSSSTSTFASEFPATVKWWTESIVQPQVHIFDRYLYNDTLGEFTVDAYLEDLLKRYGGIDSVMLWAGKFFHK